MNDYYIYTAKIDNTIVYIGKGKGNRSNHLTSGTSHLYEANKAHFAGVEVVVKTVCAGMSEEAALTVERELILVNKPAWNTANVYTKEERDFVQNRQSIKTTEGLARAKAQGVKLGRPAATDTTAKVQAAKDNGLSQSQVVKALSISLATVKRHWNK